MAPGAVPYTCLCNEIAGSVRNRMGAESPFVSIKTRATLQGFEGSGASCDAFLLRRGGGRRPLNSAAARRLRASFDPSGNGIGCWGIPALPGPCSHHGCTGRGACLPSGGVPAVPLTGVSSLIVLLPLCTHCRKADKPREPTYGTCVRLEACFLSCCAG